MKKKRNIILGFIFILISASFICFLLQFNFSNERDEDSIECRIDADCLPKVEKYCSSNNLICNFTVSYKCLRLSEFHSECVPVNCTNYCNEKCDTICRGGYCLNNSLVDLIIENVTTILRFDSGNVTVGVIIKNIGTETSPPTATRVFISSPLDQEFLLQTPSLSSGERVLLEQIYYMQPFGTRAYLDAFVDYQNIVPEINEENNHANRTITMMHY